MFRNIVHYNNYHYQLVSLGIEIVSQVLAMADCCKDVHTDEHFFKAVDAAKKWNEVFFEIYVDSHTHQQNRFNADRKEAK